MCQLIQKTKSASDHYYKGQVTIQVGLSNYTDVCKSQSMAHVASQFSTSGSPNFNSYFDESALKFLFIWWVWNSKIESQIFRQNTPGFRHRYQGILYTPGRNFTFVFTSGKVLQKYFPAVYSFCHLCTEFVPTVEYNCS